jgi:uncharacterized protein
MLIGFFLPSHEVQMFRLTVDRCSMSLVRAFVLLVFVQGMLFAGQHPISISSAVAQVSEHGLDSQVWYGEMEAHGRQFRFVMTTWLDETGKRNGKLISKDEGEQEFELDKVVVTDSDLQFELPSTKATFKGKAEPGEKKFKGAWKQRGASIDLEFNAVEAVPEDKPDEVWVGDLKAGFQQIKMQMRVYRDGDGKTRAFFDSLSQKAGGFIAEWKANDNEISISVPAVGGEFKGKLSEDGESLAGHWKQGSSFPLTLKRASEPAPYKVLSRPQNPVGEPGYRVEEVTFENPRAGIRLAGTLTFPGDPKDSEPPAIKYPSAILISGSGPQDRDETLLGHKPFWVLADYLTRNGIAVLRFDERGVGKSTGDFAGSTSENFADDVRSAMDFLKQHPVIDPEKIGLIGHSEGGLVAPMVAAESPDVAWIILLAGPGVNGEQILYSQGKLIIESAGGSPEDAARFLILQEVTFDAMRDVPVDGKIDDLIEPAVETIIERVKANAERDKKDDASADSDADDIENPDVRKGLTSMVEANLKQMHDPWFRFFAKHEPGPVLQKVRCPVLALNGERDVQVDSGLNLPKIEEALIAGGNTRFRILEMPELNHLFQTSKTGSLTEYEDIEETFAPAALKVIGDWIREQTAISR